MSHGNFVRVLNNREVLALAFGAMIGWGWVVLAGGWVNSAGALGAMLAFAIGGVAVILIGLTYAELASAMPLTGGEHVYSHRAFGMGGRSSAPGRSYLATSRWWPSRRWRCRRWSSTSFPTTRSG